MNKDAWEKFLKDLCRSGEASFLINSTAGGTLTSINIGTGKTVVFGVFNNPEDYEAFRDNGLNGYLHAIDVTEATWDPLKNMPHEPKRDAPIYEWIDYYHKAKYQGELIGIKTTWKKIAEKSIYSESNLKQTAKRLHDCQWNNLKRKI